MSKYRVNAACVLYGQHGEIAARGGEVVELSAQDHARAIAQGQGHKLTPVVVEDSKPAAKHKRSTRRAK
jgi:hypothetical protein